MLIICVSIDAEAAAREAEAISPDGLTAAQQRELLARAQNYTFQTEVNRMMKLIINSLYRNKEVHLHCLSLTQLFVHCSQFDCHLSIADIPARADLQRVGRP